MLLPIHVLVQMLCLPVLEQGEYTFQAKALWDVSPAVLHQEWQRGDCEIKVLPPEECTV